MTKALSIEKLAESRGVSIATIYKQIKAAKIEPAEKQGRRKLWNPDDFGVVASSVIEGKARRKKKGGGEDEEDPVEQAEEDARSKAMDVIVGCFITRAQVALKAGDWALALRFLESLKNTLTPDEDPAAATTQEEE